MKVVVDRAIPFLEGVLEPFATVEYHSAECITAAVVADADALIIRTRTRCNRALLEGSRVQFIATATIGFDHIDLDYCKGHNIGVATAAGCNARGVLQWVAAVLVHLSKVQGFVPEQRTLGIVGVGNVGSLVKEYAEQWGFKVICCDPPRQQRENLDFVTLEELIPQVDILTLHTPLDNITRGMINSATLATLRHGATVINASRGEVASTEALLGAPQRLCLDVWEDEPNINLTLLEKAFIATPHIAGYSAQGKANASSIVVQAIARKFDLPLTEWYPAEVQRVERAEIGWEQMCQSIAQYCDLKEQTAELRHHSSNFESLRNNYHYREEYF